MIQNSLYSARGASPSLLQTPKGNVITQSSAGSSLVKWGLLLLGAQNVISRVSAQHTDSLRGASNVSQFFDDLKFELTDSQRHNIKSNTSSSVKSAVANVNASATFELDLNDIPEPLANITSYLNGDLSGELAPADLIMAAREYLANNPLPHVAEALSPFEAHLFAFMKSQYLLNQTDAIPTHVAWHEQHGSGGTEGQGSGEEFLGFHRGMQNDIKHFLGSLNQTIPKWTQFNSNITQIIPAPAGVLRGEEDLLSGNSFLKPSFLTKEGGDDRTVLDDKNISSLEDIATPDELGRIIGEQFHGIGHVVIGGTMMGFESPRDPIFDTWHGALDDILNDWIDTNAGQAFIQSDPGKAWFSKQDSLTGLSGPSAAPSLVPSDLVSDMPSQSPSVEPSDAKTNEPAVSVFDKLLPSSGLEPSAARSVSSTGLAAGAVLMGIGLNLV